MIIQLLQYVAGVFMVVGAIFSLLAALGILRLPDLYTRMHAAAKAGPVGAGLVLLAIAMASFDGPVILRALAGIFFLLLTLPVSAHLLARAAHLAGYRPAAVTVMDELQNETSTKP